MKTHFIFERKTGKILHVHISDEGQDVSREGILHKLSSTFKKTDFDVHTVEGITEPGNYRMDLQKKILVREKGKDSAFGGGGLNKRGTVNFSKNVKTTYKRT